jgi:hypothetical protein
VNVEAMDVALQAKFTQHEDLREKFSEQEKKFIEDSPVRRSARYCLDAIPGGLKKKK